MSVRQTTFALLEKTMPTVTVNTEVAGTVWKVLVSLGDKVVQDQELVIIESMKMEIPCCAPKAGTVHTLWVNEGDVLQEGQAVALIELA